MNEYSSVFMQNVDLFTVQLLVDVRFFSYSICHVLFSKTIYHCISGPDLEKLKLV